MQIISEYAGGTPILSSLGGNPIRNQVVGDCHLLDLHNSSGTILRAAEPVLKSKSTVPAVTRVAQHRLTYTSLQVLPKLLGFVDRFSPRSSSSF